MAGINKDESEVTVTQKTRTSDDDEDDDDDKFNFFIQTVKSSIKSFWDDIFDSFKTLSIFSDYSYVSVFLFFIFSASKIFSLGIDLLKKLITSSEKIPKEKIRGYTFVNIIYFMVIFYIDFYKRCNEKQVLQKNFLEITEQLFLVMIPVYGIWFSLFRCSYHRDTEVMNLILNTVEGVSIFVLYNWAMNFREKYGYSRCSGVTEEDIEAQSKEQGKAQIHQEFRFKDHPYYDDPTVYSTTVTTTKITTTGDPDRIVVKKHDPTLVKNPYYIGKPPDDQQLKFNLQFKYERDKQQKQKQKQTDDDDDTTEYKKPFWKLIGYFFQKIGSFFSNLFKQVLGGALLIIIIILFLFLLIIAFFKIVNKGGTGFVIMTNLLGITILGVIIFIVWLLFKIL